MALPHGPPNRPAEVVALQRRLGAGVRNQRKSRARVEAAIEVVARVQRLIPEVVEQLAMEVVRARARRHRHDRTIAAAILGTEGLVVNLELGGRVD